jgi:hypothetical protein
MAPPVVVRRFYAYKIYRMRECQVRVVFTFGFWDLVPRFLSNLTPMLDHLIPETDVYFFRGEATDVEVLRSGGEITTSPPQLRVCRAI